MTVKTKIPDIDKQGEAKVILTDYQPHTISIVGEGALGVNITKVKSKDNTFLETEKGKNIMSKIEKAKSLEAEQENLDPVETPEEADAEVNSEDVPKEGSGEETTPEEVTETDNGTTDEDQADPVNKAKSDKDLEESTDDVDNTESTEDVEQEDEVIDQQEDQEDGDTLEEQQPVNKAKAYTSEELIQAQKDALDGVHNLVKKLMESVPDAEVWEVTDLVYSAIWKVEDAVYDAKCSLWDEIYNEVYKEVSERVTKAKTLKVQEEGDLENKLKALENLDPEMAKLFKTQLQDSKQKALDAEQEKQKVLRAKAIEQGQTLYKRIATDDNPVEAIVDAMTTLEVENSAVHSVIAKALTTASNITMAGELFADVGSSEESQNLPEGEYVDQKAKALVDEEGGNLAAARATVRQTEEYRVLYG